MPSARHSSRAPGDHLRRCKDSETAKGKHDGQLGSWPRMGVGVHEVARRDPGKDAGEGGAQASGPWPAGRSAARRAGVGVGVGVGVGEGVLDPERAGVAGSRRPAAAPPPE